LLEDFPCTNEIIKTQTAIATQVERHPNGSYNLKLSAASRHAAKPVEAARERRCGPRSDDRGGSEKYPLQADGIRQQANSHRRISIRQIDATRHAYGS